MRALNQPSPKASHIPKHGRSLACEQMDIGFIGLPDITVQNSAGGTYIGDEVTIKGVNKLTENLIVIAIDDIVVDGGAEIILYGGYKEILPGRLPIGVTLISLNGDIIFSKKAVIKAEFNAPPGYAPSVEGAQAVATGGPGTNASAISFSATNIFIDGNIFGSNGGWGGSCEAIGKAAKNQGGMATAFSGPGAYGGDVILSACESIEVGPEVFIAAGYGGEGGKEGPSPSPHEKAFAQADNGKPAIAIGGDGGDGGEVVFVGLGKDLCKVDIKAGATVVGGGGGNGGDSLAKGGSGNKGNGGPAFALGGDAGTASTVRFIHCEVKNAGTVESGKGGQGGFSRADGGYGDDAAPKGFEGGLAWSAGGQGQNPGPKPTYDDPQGNPQKGTSGFVGSGGGAEAEGGNGGDGTGAGGVGGPSGAGIAAGGPGGDGQTPPPSLSAPQDPNGDKGGDSQEVKSP
jgi:hypothetical protein